MLKKILFALLTIGVIATTSEAALVTRDLVSGSNDGLITLDTQTGLEWLDVSYTKGISSPYYILEGDPYDAYPNINFSNISTFRFATLSEIQSLCSDANVGLNLNTGWTSFATNDVQNAGSLISMLGPTKQYQDTVWGTGGPNTVYATEIMGFFVPSGGAPTTLDRIWMGYYYEDTNPPTIWANTFHDPGLSPGLFPDAGYFLVRNSAAPVPIPGAVWLLGSGLIGLIGIRRRFKK